MLQAACYGSMTALRCENTALTCGLENIGTDTTTTGGHLSAQIYYYQVTCARVDRRSRTDPQVKHRAFL